MLGSLRKTGLEVHYYLADIGAAYSCNYLNQHRTVRRPLVELRLVVQCRRYGPASVEKNVLSPRHRQHEIGWVPIAKICLLPGSHNQTPQLNVILSELAAPKQSTNVLYSISAPFRQGTDHCVPQNLSFRLDVEAPIGRLCRFPDTHFLYSHHLRQWVARSKSPALTWNAWWRLQDTLFCGRCMDGLAVL